jgi:hypothetical protein
MPNQADIPSDLDAARNTFPYDFIRRINIDPNGCWLWGGHVSKQNGYGAFYQNGTRHYVHRFAFQLSKGVVPSGLDVCHECDVRHCVNPNHLYAATRSENIRDMMRKNRAGWQKDPEKYKQFGRRVGSLKGEMNSSSKLNRMDVDVIKYLLEKGCFYTDISKLFGVETASISDIAHGRTWK